MKPKAPKRTGGTCPKKNAEIAEQSTISPGKFKVARKVDEGTFTLNPEDVGLGTLEKAFGTANSDVQTHLLGQVLRAFDGVIAINKGADGIKHDINQSRLSQASDIVISVLKGVQPRDEIELMLVTQMIAVHNLAMQNLAGGLLVTDPDVRNSVINQATKMLRTYTSQMEALKRYRTGGQQKVTVEHVTVNKGGQAIVGSVSQGGKEGGS